MSIITISGLDGSGKSTQIELLKKYLQSQGKTFWYFHAVEYSVADKFSRIKDQGSRINSSITKANWFQILLRKIALLVDVFRFRRLLKKIRVDYIISDRYFYDSVVNINYLSFRRPMSKRLFSEKFIPKPDVAFYLKVPPERIMQRERKPDQGMEYLEVKEKLYEQKIKEWDMVILDGERNIEEINKTIVDKILSH